MLKAQPWHFKPEGVISAAFDCSVDLADVDLDGMAILAQVCDLPFELMMEDMG